eukprot:2094583-Rhodomonas_salina.3
MPFCGRLLLALVVTSCIHSTEQLLPLRFAPPRSRLELRGGRANQFELRAQDMATDVLRFVDEAEMGTDSTTSTMVWDLTGSESLRLHPGAECSPHVRCPVLT